MEGWRKGRVRRVWRKEGEMGQERESEGTEETGREAKRSEKE